jgi:adenylate cyclase
MTETRVERAVLLADITGSTPLYEAVGDVEAVQRIGRCVDRMRHLIEADGGIFVAAKGDDVLATFEVPDAALAAVEAILAEMPMGGLSVHAGLHFGQVVLTREDVFGDAVNLTARLASKANPGEVLISRDFAAQLSRPRAATLRPLNAMTLKGKSLPVEVFSLNDDTRFFPVPRPAAAAAPGVPRRVSVVLAYGGLRRVVQEGASLSVGRAPDNDIVVDKPWVSRRHATIAVTDDRVQLTDRSSYGSYLTIADAAEMVARRETVVLAGSGRLSPGTSADNPDAVVIAFEVNAG